MDSSMPMVSAAPQKAELRIGLAEQFAEGARERVDDRKQADDAGRAASARQADRKGENDRTAAALRAPLHKAGLDGAAAVRRWGTPTPTARRSGGPTVRH